MFIPVGDTPNLRGIPYVTRLLIAVNVAVHLLIAWPSGYLSPDLNDPLLAEYLLSLGAQGMISVAEVLRHVNAYDLIVFRYGFIPADFDLYRLLSSLFLHAGWMHLFGNMLFLWIFGNNVELRLGRLRFLLAYLGTGVASILFFALFVSDSAVPLIGASGAISGVLGIYFLLFPRNQIRTFVFLFPFIITTILIPARWVLGFYLVVDNLLPFLFTGGGADSGVAYGAHLGGFFSGMAAASIMNRPPAEKSKEADRKAAAQDALSRSIRKGHWADAADLYAAGDSPELRREMNDRNLVLLGEYLLRTRRFEEAVRLYRCFIVERPASSYLAEASLGAATALIALGGHEKAARQYLLTVLDLSAERAIQREARKLLETI